MAPAGGAVAGPHDALIAKHSAAYGVPETLVRRVIHIESKGNARVVSKGNYGLMQIRLGTAKSMGYRGTADGLLDADTNMTYAVKYLASAYRAAGCNEQRAINYYQRGFYKRPTSKCALPRSTTQIASVERPAAKRSMTDRDTGPASADVLQPRVVQVQTIVRPKSAMVQPAAPAQVATAPVSGPVAVAPPAAPAPAPRSSAPWFSRPSRRLPRRKRWQGHPSRICLRRRRKTLRRFPPCSWNCCRCRGRVRPRRRRRWRSSKQQRSHLRAQNDAVNASPDVQVAKLEFGSGAVAAAQARDRSSAGARVQARSPCTAAAHVRAGQPEEA